MKVNRTYSMDYDLVIALAKKQNQSLEVCRAVRAHLNTSTDVQLCDATIDEILAQLMVLFDAQSTEMELLRTIRGLRAKRRPSGHS
jgi:hypothetical protein